MRLFAHDTSLTASDKNIDDLLPRTNSELLTIYYDWLYSSKLTLNHLKTRKYLIFQPRQKVYYNLLLPLTLAGQYLQQILRYFILMTIYPGMIK